MENGSRVEYLTDRLAQAAKRLAAPFHTFVVQLFEIIAAILASVLVARYLGVGGMGVFILAFNIAGLLAITLLFGTHDIAIRMYATKVTDPRKVLGAVLWILVIGDGICLLLAVLISALLALSLYQIFIVMLATVVLLINGLGSVFSQAIVAYDKSRYDVQAVIAVRALQVGGLFIALEFGSLAHVMVVYILSACFLAVIRALIVHRKCFAVRLVFDPQVRKGVWSSGWKVGLGAVFGTISTRSDVLILEGMTSTEVVGIYGVAYRVVNGASTGIAAIASALFPRVAKAMQVGQQTLEVKLFIVLPFLIAFVSCVGAVFVAKPIIDVLYGPEFEAAIVVLQVLLIVVALTALIEFYTRYLIASGREHHLPKSQGVGAAVNITLNLVLIPSLGAMGAALATVGSCIATLIYFLLLIIGNRFRILREKPKPIGSGS